MVANCLLYCGNGLLWKRCPGKQFCGKCCPNLCMIPTKVIFACLSQIVKGNRCPDSWEITAFTSMNGICQCHNSHQVVEVMGSILASFAHHRFMGQPQH